MSQDGYLGAEVERKSAEIRTWPAWAQPFEQESPPSAHDGPPPASSTPPPREPSENQGQR